MKFNLYKVLSLKIHFLIIVCTLLFFSEKTYGQAIPITAIGTCDGIAAVDENTYNILISGLDAMTIYDIDVDGDDVADELGVTGVMSFTVSNIPYVDGTSFRNIQIDANTDGTFETSKIVHEVLCTDADDDGTLDFSFGCDEDLVSVDRGFMVATISPYLGMNVYVYVLTNSANNALAANNSGLFTNLPNGSYNVLAFNFSMESDANNFFNGLMFGENGTAILPTTVPTGCSTNCGTIPFEIDCENLCDPAFFCNDVVINLGAGECESIVNYNFPPDCNFQVETTIESGAVFPIGTTTVGVTITDDFGNVETCNFNVTINEFVPSNITMTCNSLINVGLDENCQAIIAADMILDGNNYGCYNDFTVMVLNGPNDTDPPLILPNTPNGSPIVNGGYTGQTLAVKIIDPITGLTCWGQITIEDKLIPDLVCNNTIVNCTEDTTPSNLGFPLPTTASVIPTADTQTFTVTNFDACGPTTLVFEDIETGELCVGTKIITRTWTATDGSGNETSCTETITILPTSISDVIAELPDDVTVECGTSLPPPLTQIGCGNIDISLAGDPVIIDICEASFKMIRTYVITDWCTNQTVEHVQLLKVLDTEAPMITCPADITIGNTFTGCGGNVDLPQPTATDACGNNITFTVESSAGNLNGFQLTGLPSGTHQVTYTATDDCGNASTCTINVIVEDDIAPLTVCEESTVVSLGSDGTAVVNAFTFDDGSTDNCVIVDYQVRRMDNPNCTGMDATSFGPNVPFFCCDIGNIIMVELQVTDAVGNSNTCMVEVQVQDKIDPTLICPPNKNLECDAAFVDEIVAGQPLPTGAAAAYGNAVGTDNCNEVTVTNVVIENTVSDCGVGVVTILWTATDENENSTQCIQTYNVGNSSPFYINANDVNDPNDDVVWCPDYTVNTCGVGLDPNDLPTPYNAPVINQGACDNIGVGHIDQVLEFSAGDACLKILRKWYVVDWCQAASNQDPTQPGPGAWQYVQVIKVINSTDPIITTVNLPQVIDNFEENCGGVFAAFEITADDDCTDQSDLTTTWETSNGLTGNGFSASGIFTNGNHSITFIVNDECGNTSNLTHNFTVKDAKKPTPICIYGISTAVMPSSGMLMLSVNDFESGSSYDNCTAYNDLVFSFSQNVSDVNLVVNCTDIPANGLYPVKIYATDEAGNFNFCTTFVNIQDPTGNCPSTALIVNGIVENENQEVVEEVMVNLTNPTGIPAATPVMTTTSGNYVFNMNLGNYDVIPEKDTFPLNGVTTYDLVLISKHILGIELLDSPYKIIAADANHSNTVTTLDIVTIRKVILHIADEFTNNTSWRFVPMDFEFDNPINPFTPQFPESTNLAGMSGAVAADFIGVKIGDVNNTSQPNQLVGTDTRNTIGDLVFNVEDQQLEAGTEVEIEFLAEDFQTSGYQFTLQFDADKLEFIDLQTQLEELSVQNFGLQYMQEGIITTSWNQEKVINKAKGNGLFKMQFKVLENTKLSEVLSINSRFTAAEAYRGNELLDVVLNFPGKTMVTDRFELYQNRPNPFRKNTTIGFNIPEATNATLRIFDSSGRVLKEIEKYFAKGYNEVSISNEELKAHGILIYELKTPTNVARRKMLIID